MRPDALLIDVGGVLVLPDRSIVTKALLDDRIPHDPSRMDAAHYHAIHYADRCDDEADGRSYGEVYRDAYLVAIGVAEPDLSSATAVLDGLFVQPSQQLWCQVIPGARETLRALVDAGYPIAIVSNADGTVEASLAKLAICQSGPGPATSVGTIVDSTVVGFSKPDPRIFRHALALLGVRPESSVFVGDSERNDICGAERSGMQAVHVDPFRLCRRQGAHRHIRTLSELLPILGVDERVT
ncbi:MAG: HAD family hydrolase [Acidimicrobiales bacterium]